LQPPPTHPSKDTAGPLRKDCDASGKTCLRKGKDAEQSEDGKIVGNMRVNTRGREGEEECV